MPFNVLYPWMLLGLAGLAIPVIIHLLNRRRYDVVDWGAMQFLKISEVTRRRLMLEEILLMLLRMALIALLVLGLAGPFVESATLARLGPRGNRDVVLVLDGSYSMGYSGMGVTCHDAAKDWASNFVNGLGAGDSVAILQAKQQVVPLVGELSVNLRRVRDKLAHLPPPAGGGDWQSALREAHKIIARGERAEKDIILLGDGQKFGWADEDSLVRWELLAHELGLAKEATAPRPRLWVVNVMPDRPQDPPNWALAPLSSNRPIVSVDREVVFRTELVLHGQAAYSPPHKIRFEVDGKWVRDLEPPKSAKLEKGRAPFSFTHRFAAAGSHLVSVILEPDPPPAARPAGYVIKDHLPGDNRQDYAVEVMTALPVLLVDGDTSPSARFRGSDFLRDALSPARDKTPSIRATVVSIQEFTPAILLGEPGAEPTSSRPRVLMLCNVGQLTPQQSEAIGQFLADGGGLLVTLGDRADADFCNSQLFRDGQGWLPARLDGIEGEETAFRTAARPTPASTSHPTLEIFRDMPAGGLADARFPRWWKLTTPGKNASGIPVAALRSATLEYPFLVERAFKAGRVLLASVPLDSTWGTNLPSLPAFVPLGHELVYYLAGARSADFNLQAGQPLRCRLDSEGSVERFTLQTPFGEPESLSTDPTDSKARMARIDRQARGSVLVIEGARETGVYRLGMPDGRTTYFVLQPDGRESNLTAATGDDRARVSKLVPGLQYQNDPSAMLEAPTTTSQRQLVWWWFLLGLVALLCGEVWMTRRMVKNR